MGAFLAGFFEGLALGFMALWGTLAFGLVADPHRATAEQLLSTQQLLIAAIAFFVGSIAMRRTGT